MNRIKQWWLGLSTRAKWIIGGVTAFCAVGIIGGAVSPPKTSAPAATAAPATAAASATPTPSPATPTPEAFVSMSFAMGAGDLNGTTYLQITGPQAAAEAAKLAKTEGNRLLQGVPKANDGIACQGVEKNGDTVWVWYASSSAGDHEVADTFCKSLPST